MANMTPALWGLIERAVEHGLLEGVEVRQNVALSFGGTPQTPSRELELVLKSDLLGVPQDVVLAKRYGDGDVRWKNPTAELALVGALVEGCVAQHISLTSESWCSAREGAWSSQYQCQRWYGHPEHTGLAGALRAALGALGVTVDETDESHNAAVVGRPAEGEVPHA